MVQSLNRRRFIAISAATAGLSLMPFGSKADAGAHVVTWRGQALGAPASLAIHHCDRAEAVRLVERVGVEVARLEQVFSLYREDSALSQLNRLGAIAAPPADLVALLEISHRYWKASGGMFDPTVQPLWTVLASHFSKPVAAPGGPPAPRIREALNLVGFHKVRFNRGRIVFAQRGMALTLNGIAQGYMTDRVVELLRSGGVTKSLVDMGEIRALGTRVDGQPWKVGVESDESEPPTILDVTDKAVATSSADGFQFDPAGRFNHLLDPRTGCGARLYRSVTVVAPEAVGADALSTAFALMDLHEVQKVVAAHHGVQVRLLAKSADLRPIYFKSSNEGIFGRE